MEEETVLWRRSTHSWKSCEEKEFIVSYPLGKNRRVKVGQVKWHANWRRRSSGSEKKDRPGTKVAFLTIV